MEKSIADILLHVTRELVINKDSIDITSVQEKGATIFRLRVAESDVGRIVGTSGRTESSLRTLLRALSAKADRRFELAILIF